MGEDHFTKSNIVYKYHGGNNLQKVPIMRNILMESVGVCIFQSTSSRYLYIDLIFDRALI